MAETAERQISKTSNGDYFELKPASGAFSSMAGDTNRFSAAGNHPLAAQKWNHSLAETAIGWSL